MIELLAANSGRVIGLRKVTILVLDEADRLLDLGFEPQVMKIISSIRPTSQKVVVSATFPRMSAILLHSAYLLTCAGQMEALARKVLSRPIEIIVGGRSVVVEDVHQIVEVRPESTKFHRLLELLGELYNDEANEDARTLIFVERQKSADELLNELMRKGYPCNSIHGGKDQNDRDSTIADFKAGVIPVLIATSVAARGLDVKQLKLVVNYDCPNHLEDYVHRVGRTGRAGNKGTAVTFITEEQDRYGINIAKALKYSGQPIPEPLQKLVDSFMDKVKTGKAELSASGFGGKGLERLDQDRDAAKSIWGKAFKTGDEPEEEKTEKTADLDDDAFVIKGATIESSTPFTDESSIIVHKSEPAPTKTGPDNRATLDKVREAVANIGNRLNTRNQLSSFQHVENRGPDAGAFHSTLGINDLNQKSRWAVTNRTNVAKILDQFGVAITSKGNFYAAGKEPGPNDPSKLYLLVEGDSELSVRGAMKELLRLLQEAEMAAATQESKAPTGRYNVV
jgi:ATP-dependent RNA helicase DDX46/PRP5